jgi:ankyrin repeat protein
VDTTQTRPTVLSLRVDDEALKAIDLLVQAGMAQSRSEAAGQFVALGIRSAGEMLQRARQVAEQLQGLRSELLAAVKAKDAASVQALLEQDPTLLRSWSEGGDTPVLLSAYYGAQDVTKLLLQHNANLSFFEAAAVGELPRLRQLRAVQPELLHAYSHDGWTALHLAAFFGHAEVAAHLLSQGADPNRLSRNNMGNLPLHSALAGRRFDVAQMLIERGTRPTIADAAGWTPLHHAAYTGRAQIVEMLLARGASASARNDKGQTPAQIAEEQGHNELAERLRSLE